MEHWLGQLRDDLNRLEELQSLRTLRPVQHQGRWIKYRSQKLLNFASNDYLALASHPHLKNAAIQAIKDHGTGCGSSRLIAGHQPLHAKLEARFAKFKNAQAALLCPTGYMANLALITSLASKSDLICVDKLNHASLIDAAHASGATVRTYPHRQTPKLKRLLQRHASSTTRSTNKRPPRRFIVTDSVFSMDGDTANLPALCQLAQQYHAILIVDEAHATGILGHTGSGLAEHLAVTDHVDVTVSTASKALGSLGGIITARREIIDTIINHARPFIFTTATPPAQTAAIDAALDVIQNQPQRRQRVLALATHLRTALNRLDLPATTVPPVDITTPIIPLILGPTDAALSLAHFLQQHHIFAPAIRPPTVAPNSSRIRFTLRADLHDADIDHLVKTLQKWFSTR